jgi:hypothetical protein
MFRCIVRFGLLIGLLFAGASSASAQLTFNIINGGTATAQMMTGVQQAGALWSSYFNDPITVNIRVNASATLGSGVIAHTDTFYDTYTYASVRAALVSDKTSGDDLASTNHLQAGPAISMLINKTANNPNGVVSATPYFDTGLGGPGQAGPENNNTIRMSSANAKAIGLYPANSAGTDGIITLSTLASFDFDRSNGISSGQLDFVGVVSHEIGHMLGFASGVDILAGNSAAPGLNDNLLKYVTPLDLFKFSSRSAAGGNGVIDWTADSVDKSFSIDGGSTLIAPFSNGTTFEESHWKNNLGLGLMNPTASTGVLMGFSNNDLQAFDVIGYNLASVPEPETYLMIGLISVTGLIYARRRSNRLKKEMDQLVPVT